MTDNATRRMFLSTRDDSASFGRVLYALLISSISMRVSLARAPAWAHLTTRSQRPSSVGMLGWRASRNISA